MLFPVNTSPIPILCDPPFALLLMVLAAALGRRTLRILGAELTQATALERSLVMLITGIGLLPLGPFLLGCFGLLKPTGLWILLAVLAAGLFGDIRAVVRGGLSAVRTAGIDRSERTVLLILGLFLLALLPQTLSPPTDGDGVGYHLTAPRLWLSSGWMHYIPTFQHTNNPMGLQMIYAICLGLWSDTSAKLMHFSVGCIALLLAYALGRRVAGTHVGMGAAALFLLGLPMLAAKPYFTWAYIDLGYAAATLGACLAWCLWRSHPTPGGVRLIGLLAGIILSFKLHGALSGIVLSAMCAAQLGRDAALSRKLGTTANILVMSSIPGLPWLLRSWIQTGNPVYPLFSGLFRTRDMSPAESARFSEYFRYYGWGTSSLFRSLSMTERKLMLVAAALLVLAACVWIVRSSRNADLKGVTVFTASMVIPAIASTGLYMRYMLPFTPLAWIVILAVTAGAEAGRTALQKALPIYAVVLSLYHLVSVHPGAELRRHLLAVRASAGLAGRSEAISFELPDYPLVERLNRELPPDAHLLTLSAIPFFYVDRRVAILRTEWTPTETWEQFLTVWRGSGADHLVLHADLFTDHTGGAMLPPSIMFARRLAAEFGDTVLENRSLRIIRIRPIPASGGGA
jgi:hypothetical protein